MTRIERLHAQHVSPRRHKKLCELLAGLLPEGARVLDVGCGDGTLTAVMASRRPDLELKGIDVLVRDPTHVPVRKFDGKRIPYEDASFDAVMLIDVLHHTHDPAVLLKEAARVAWKSVLVKDHIRDGWLGDATLRLMDYIGNLGTGISIPYNYWPRARWAETFASLGLGVGAWVGDLGLYPWPADRVFGRSLHFLARLDVAGDSSPAATEPLLLKALP